LAAFVPQTVTSWLIGYNLGTPGNGLFGAALQLPKMTEVTMNAVGTASYPTLAGLMRDSGPDSKRQQSRIYTLLILAAIGISLVVAVLSPIGIRILYAREYHEAIAYAPVLALAWMFTGLFLIVSQPVYFVGGGKWLSTASITAAVVHLGVSVPAIRHFGLWGAAWSLVAGNAVLFTVAASAGQRVYSLPWEYSKIAAALASAVFIGLADVYLCQSLDWIASIPVKLGLLIVWAALLRATGALSAYDMARAWTWLLEKARLYRRGR
jgi:O-antigen/teichoic acid export membrane protein